MKLIVLALSGVTGLLLFAFNNCSNVAFDTSAATLLVQQLEFESSSSIQIDSGAEFTRQSLVQLKLNSPRAIEMKISNLNTCADGTWEPYTSGKVWTLTKANDRAEVFVKYKDIVGNETQCVSDDIVHDNIAPTASFANAPNVVTKNNQTSVSWTAQDNLSGVDKTLCRDDGSLAVPCTSMKSVTSSTDGVKSVFVQVTDKAGNTSQEYVYNWLYDGTPPVVSVNSRPALISGSASASVGFSATDALSGVDKYLCRADGSAFAPCVSPQQLSGLMDGAHKVEIRAIDKAGNESAIVSVDWSVDMTAPNLMFTMTPNAVSNSLQAQFGFTGSDNGQPITQFECNKDGGGFAACVSPTASTFTEGPHNYQVRGYDSAGNVSSPISYNWLIDVTPPSVNITSGPASVTNLSAANFQWTAADSGSGVKSVECKIDAQAYMACGAGGQNFANLQPGPHTLTVRVTDNAGNMGTDSHSWNIDVTPPTIQILSGPNPYVKATAAQFTFIGNDANGIAGYECRVDAGNYGACITPHNVSALAEGGHIFFVRAIDKAGNVSMPASHSWTIDLSPPIIRIISAPTAIKSGDPAKISYEVIDPSSGVQLVRCGLSGSLAACTAVQQVDLGTALAAGSYTFQIEATDKVGNMMTENVSFQVTARPVICDPFVVGGDATCNGGLVGDIFYLNDAHQAAFKAMGGKTVDYFYANGIQVNALLALKQLFVTTRSFTEGFPSSNGGLILDNNNQTLVEYFAFRLETVLKLDATLDQPGWYQFATLSDDGSMVLLKPTGSTTYSQTVVANDGDHATSMGCSNSAIYIDDTSRLPLMVKYYQGPRTQIALTMLWRRVAAMNTAKDQLCGVGTNDLTGLASRGWRVINPSNFIAPPRP